MSANLKILDYLGFKIRSFDAYYSLRDSWLVAIVEDDLDTRRPPGRRRRRSAPGEAAGRCKQRRHRR